MVIKVSFCQDLRGIELSMALLGTITNVEKGGHILPLESGPCKRVVCRIICNEKGAKIFRSLRLHRVEWLNCRL
jgi:hypothetical protein